MTSLPVFTTSRTAINCRVVTYPQSKIYVNTSSKAIEVPAWAHRSLATEQAAVKALVQMDQLCCWNCGRNPERLLTGLLLSRGPDNDRVILFVIALLLLLYIHCIKQCIKRG